VTVHLIDLSFARTIGGCRASAATGRTASLFLPVGQIADVRGKLIFCNGFNVMLPVQSLPKKYSCSRSPQITATTRPSRPGRGALAIVTNVGAGRGGRGSVGRVVVFAGRALVRERTQRADDRRQCPA